MDSEPPRPVWEAIGADDERRRLWDRFDAEFAFDPHAWRDGRPTIAEPAGSVTFDLRAAIAEPDIWIEEAVSALVVRALARVVGDGEPLVVLDWQHQAYRFWPRRTPKYPATLLFPHEVFPWPDGDYYVFVAPDFVNGTFGHPWEHTLCVFGERLVPLLEPVLGQLLPIVRRQ